MCETYDKCSNYDSFFFGTNFAKYGAEGLFVMRLNNLLGKVTKISLGLLVTFGFMLFSNTAAQAQYRDYGRNGGYYGRNGGYGNDIYRIAEQNGYNDGLRKGAEDAREGHNNPTNTSDYKRATNGYDSRYGNKDGYKQAYRQAFLQGFDEAQRNYYYNGNGRYGNGRYDNRTRRTNTGATILRRILLGY